MRIRESFPIIKQLNNKYTLFKWRQRRVSNGDENADKVFYVIRRARCKCGLFSYVIICLGGIDYALKKGYIPIVDMQNEPNAYLKDELVGKENAWEYFFEQPAGYSLNDINSSKNIILSDGLTEHVDEHPDCMVGWDEANYNYWHSLAKKTFFINSNLLSKFQEDLQFDASKTIGVLARGTDYNSLKLSQHPIQPSSSELMEKIDELLITGKYANIFLATEDDEIYSDLLRKYGDKLIAPAVVRYKASQIGNINETAEMVKDPYSTGVDYLKSIWILSKCNALVAGNVSGTIGALLLNDKYEYKYIFNKGLYE